MILKLLTSNWISGLTVGLVSIPIAISLAVASHASPVAGIITALWAGLMASLFGGSNYNIIGPTGALAGLLLINANTHGPESLPMLAILSGIFIFFAYLVKLEKYLMFIPGSALHGFILGIALIIVLGQINAACGFNYNASGMSNQIHWPTFILFLSMLTGLLCFARFTPRLPGTIILTPLGIAIGYLSSSGFIPWQFQMLGTKYSGFSPILFQLPHFHCNLNYIFPALSIAAISIVETMISARIADGITKTKHNKRKEMLGLSIANLVSGFAGGIPATAALARTALNIRSGCTHKISAAISSICIALISLLFLRSFYYLPLAIIAAILVFVSMRMLEMEHFLRMFKIDKKNFVLSLVVAAVTVYEDATIGVLLGAVIAMLLFMEKFSEGYHEIIVQKKEHLLDQQTLAESPSTLIYKIKGPLAYINAQAHIARLENLPSYYSDVIIDLSDAHFIDFDGIAAFGDIVEILSSKNIEIYLVNLNPLVQKLLQESKSFQHLLKQHKVFEDIDDAISSIAHKKN